MSGFSYSTVKCVICGSSIEETVYEGTHTNGFYDLDLRPSGMLRITMPHLVHYCKKCGYASPTVGLIESEKVKNYVLSDEYRRVFVKLKENTGKPFILYGLILKHLGNIPKSAHTFLRAAWMYDDQHKDKIARTCRLIAIYLFEKVPHLKKENVMMLIDMKRRVGDFKGAIGTMRLYRENLEGKEDLNFRWVACERRLCIEKNTKAYSIKDLLNDEGD